MPTRNRIRGTLIEVSEKLSEIGFEVRDIHGPIDQHGEEIDIDDPNESGDLEVEEENYQYYLVAHLQNKIFYINFQTNQAYGTIVYPMDVISALSEQLETEEVDAILDKPIEWQSVDENQEYSLYSEAIQTIISNTDQIEYYRAAFNLSAYASTALVDYKSETTNTGFPIEFQCGRAFFPYTENLTLQYLDDRIMPVLIAGERGRRYVNYSFKISKDGNPNEYEIRTVV